MKKLVFLMLIIPNLSFAKMCLDEDNFFETMRLTTYNSCIAGLILAEKEETKLKEKCKILSERVELNLRKQVK